jgi:hypothetical protein
MLDALREQLPVKGLPGVRIANVEENPELPFDVAFDFITGQTQVRVLGEIKPVFSPRTLEQISPWVRRVKALNQNIGVAVVTSELSTLAQQYCIENNIDFIDLAGNLFINVPGRITLQRTGQRAPAPIARELRTSEPSIVAAAVNPFSGRSSRILRVLLEEPRDWSITEISRELSRETQRFNRELWQGTQSFSENTMKTVTFDVSAGAISKAIWSLEELLLIRRRGTAIIVAEPDRLLRSWAEKYQERYRWRLRSTFQVGNPFGPSPTQINDGIRNAVRNPYAFTSGFAAEINAPFLDIDVIDVFITGGTDEVDLRPLSFEDSTGLRIRFIRPYDVGVFMYSRRKRELPIVSEVQAYLDLYARGGRDRKQADYLLENVLLDKWTRRKGTNR